MSRLQTSAISWSSFSACRNSRGLPTETPRVNRCTCSIRSSCFSMACLSTGSSMTCRINSERFGVGPRKTCCRNKPQQEEPPVGLEAGSQLKSQGKWLGVGGTFLWDFTYLCWNLTKKESGTFVASAGRCTPLLRLEAWVRTPAGRYGQ
jgi:hypothetical protein